MGDYNQVSKQISDLIGGRSAQEQQDTANLQNQYGYQSQYDTLQGIRRNVSDTEKALSDLPGQMQQRTAGSLVTSGQLGRLVNSESDPISKNLATLNKSQGLGEQSMTDINNLITQGQNTSRLNYTDKLGYLQNVQQQLFQAQENAKARAAQQAAADAQARAQAKAYQDYVNQQKIDAWNQQTDATTKMMLGLNNRQQYEVPDAQNNGVSGAIQDVFKRTPLGFGAGVLSSGIGGGQQGVSDWLNNYPELVAIKKLLGGK